jgi:hypothetical protein
VSYIDQVVQVRNIQKTTGSNLRVIVAGVQFKSLVTKNICLKGLSRGFALINTILYSTKATILDVVTLALF